MSTAPRLKRTQAHGLPCGTAVMWPGRGDGSNAADMFICLKAERQGKEYVHHYLVAVDPTPGDGMGLIYVDPDEMVVDCGCRLTLTPDLINSDQAAEASLSPGVGELFDTQAGRFLKVIEDPKSQKMFAFIHMAPGPDFGQIRRRQERGVIAVYGRWRVTAAAGPEAVSLARIRDAYGRFA